MNFLKSVHVILLSLCVMNAFPMQKELSPKVINKVLSYENVDAETLAPLFLTAQNNNQNDITQTMLDYVQNKPDILNQLITLTRTIYDTNGDNLAISLAKKLNDTSLGNKFITETEKYVMEQTNEMFKKNLQQQLADIKNSLENAIATVEKKSTKTQSSDNNWLITFDIVNNVAADAQYKIIQHMMTNQNQVLIGHIGNKNPAITTIYTQLANNPQAKIIDIQQTQNDSVDLLIAPYTLHSQMEEIFKASQDLLRKQDATLIKTHPLFNYFNRLNDNGIFVATLCSGPNIQDFTNLVLGKHNLHLNPNDPFDDPSLKIFNNVETFFRCLDIFKTHYEKLMGKTIVCDTSFAFSHIALDIFCQKYVEAYPELKTMSAADRERFVRLLAIFTTENDVLDLSVTLKMSVQNKNPNMAARSFEPIDVTFETNLQKGSNDLLGGQQSYATQIQNLNSSEISMIYIKDADGFSQLAALQPILGREKLNLVELGGGRGETNAVLKAVKDAGSTINLLNIEPTQQFAEPYKKAHQIVGIPDVHVIQKTAQAIMVSDILNHYDGKKIDVLFASHAFYFLLGDLYKASQNQLLPLNQHPLWKYFKMLRDDGVLMITLQSGTGARQFRNALTGNYGLSTDDITPLLTSFFGNMATLLRSFDDFVERYKKETGKTIMIKMHYDVANVPLGKFTVGKDPETQGFEIHNPQGDDKDKNWLATKMMDFYGNWKEQQLLATLTPEKAMALPLDDLKKMGFVDNNAIETPEITENMIKQKRDTAIKTESTFLHILPVFAPGLINMQHPNITLEITVK